MQTATALDNAVMITTISRATVRAALHRAGIVHPADPGYESDGEGRSHVTLDFGNAEEVVAFLGALWSLVSYEERRALCDRASAEVVAPGIHVITFRDTAFAEDLVAAARL